MPPVDYDNAFVDCIRAVIRCPHEKPVGRYINTGARNDDTGEVVRQSLCPIGIPGPHGQAMVHTHDPSTRQLLDMKFCPGKYFQDHNGFASGNLQGLLVSGVLDITVRLGLRLPDEELPRLIAGDVELHEVHCTAMLDLGSDAAVYNALAYLHDGKCGRLQAHSSYHGTETFGTGGSYQVTFYNKHLEMSSAGGWGHSFDSGRRELLLSWASGKLRAEVCMKRRKLRMLNLEKAYSWNLDTPGMIVRQQLGLLRVNERPGLSPQEENALTSGEFRAYCLWRSGEDLSKAYSSHARKQYRRRFLEQGIDISVPYPTDISAQETRSDVVPFSKIIELPFEPAPIWAKGTNAYYKPSPLRDILTSFNY